MDNIILDRDASRLRFANKFFGRFNLVRSIEYHEIKDNPFQYSNESFRLLGDLENCYAAKAYYSTILIAHSLIEIHLRKIEKLKGTSEKLLQQANLKEDVDWLRLIRNDIAHGNNNDEIVYQPEHHPELAQKWEDYCLKAIKLVHEIPVRLHKAKANKK